MSHAQTPSQPNHSPLAHLLPLLAAIIAISPMAIDMYLPAMTTIATAFATDMVLVQQSMSLYLAGYALGMLFFGPLADRYGRKPLLLGGLLGFILASLLLSITTSLPQFLLCRLLQAIAGAAATVVVPGYVRQLYGANTAKGMSYVMMIMMLAPLLAPGLGSVILALYTWQTIFILLSGYAALLLGCILILRLPPDTPLMPTLTLGFWADLRQRYYRVWHYPGIRPRIGISMALSLAFFSYLTAAPMVYMTVFQLSSTEFSLLFAANVAAIMLANWGNARWVGQLGSARLLTLAAYLAWILATILLLGIIFTAPNWLQMGIIMLLMGALGVCSVNADALIIMQFSSETGTASAVIGTLKWSCGALAGPLLALFALPSALPFALLITAALTMILLLNWLQNSKYCALSKKH